MRFNSAAVNQPSKAVCNEGHGYTKIHYLFVHRVGHSAVDLMEMKENEAYITVNLTEMQRNVAYSTDITEGTAAIYDDIPTHKMNWAVPDTTGQVQDFDTKVNEAYQSST